MKKNILIVYSRMIVGGSTTSLLSLLNEMDYSLFNVDLLLFDKGGTLDAQIPANVNIIDNTFLKIKKKDIFHVLFFLFVFLKSKLHNNPLVRSQVMSKYLVKKQEKLEKEYDVAIAFLEFWPSNYVYKRVNAKKKVLWLHCDYMATKLNPKIDNQMYNDVDTVVTVSKACEKNFRILFPTVKSVSTIHNILSNKTILDLANAYKINRDAYESDLIFITVARIDFKSKGHDRGIEVFKRIKKKYPNKNFKWLVIGDGPDKIQLEEMVDNSNMENEIILLGELTNPHPYVKISDIFFLPSRYEGKPMAVTEAQMNGVVPFVTNYASASGQINHMIDGLICENHVEAIFEMMEKIFQGVIDIDGIKMRLSDSNFSNLEELKEIYEMLDYRKE